MKITRASSGGGPQLITKSITYTAGGTGAQGTTTNIFVVTGEIIVIYLVSICTTSLEESAGTPTLRLGVVNASSIFIGSITATIIDVNEFWISTGPTSNALALPAAVKDIAVARNITCTVGGTNNISAGVIRYDLYWLPLSPDGLAVPA